MYVCLNIVLTFKIDVGFCQVEPRPGVLRLMDEARASVSMIVDIYLFCNKLNGSFLGSWC